MATERMIVQTRLQVLAQVKGKGKTMAEYRLVQFDMPIPDDITLRFCKALCALAHNTAVVLNKPLGCPIDKPNGEPYSDSTYHAQAYRARAARKAGAPWTKNYPELDLFDVRYVQRKTRVVLTKRPPATK